MKRATPNEREEFVEWLNCSPENRALYRDILRGETVKRYFNNLNKAEEQMDVRSLERIISNKLVKKRSIRRTLVIVSTSVAAAAIAISFLIFDNSSDNTPIKVAQDNSVVIAGKRESKPMIVVSSNSDTDIVVPLSEDSEVVYAKEQFDKILTKVETVANPMQQVIIPNGYTYSVILSDSTKVTLNSGSSLKYLSHFGSNIREVELTGEAFFEVKSSKVPFVVKSNGGYIRVYGTDFNVNAKSKEEIKTILVSGSVGMGMEDGVEMLLKPNELGVIDVATKRGEVKQVDINHHLAWLDGFIRCVDTSYGVLFEELSAWYGVQLRYDSSDFKDEIVTISVDRTKDLDNTIKFIEEITGVSFINNGESYEIVKSE